MKTAAGHTAVAEQKPLSPREGYRLWSRVYDSQPNPMLSLEERHLVGLIPDVQGRVVLDIGCGSGRWLSRLSDCGAKRLVGIDCSPEMLACAAERGLNADLLLASSQAIPLPDNSAHLVLASFVIGYLDSLREFAAEIRRIIAPGGTVLITDLHPLTAVRHRWQRSFSLQQETFSVSGHFWPLQAVIDAFRAEKFQLTARIEPCLAAPEFQIFQDSGKAELFRALSGQPAIAILAFEAPPAVAHSSPSITRQKEITDSEPKLSHPPLRLQGARVARSGHETAIQELCTHGDRIAEPGQTSSETVDIDLGGYLLLPGLINAHDHLEFALFPRLGQRHYQNSQQWAEDIYRPSESPVREHLRVAKATRLWWGGLRNLLAGVTTVCHHNPFLPDVFNEEFPVDVPQNFGWAHSLAFEAGAAQRLAATPDSQPFFIHLAEGTDAESAGELERLNTLRSINDRTVVIHGLGLRGEDRALMRSRRAALVWCPTSNVFLFGKTLAPRELAQVGRTALGTDSPLTAAGDMLDELRLANQIGAAPDQLYDCVTSNATDILQLREGEGSLAHGSVANVVALRDFDLSPADTLIRCSFRDVALVLRRGRVQLVSDELFGRLPSALSDRLHPLMVEDHLCWVRAPLGRLFRDAVEALGCDLRLGGKEIRNVTADFI